METARFHMQHITEAEIKEFNKKKSPKYDTSTIGKKSKRVIDGSGKLLPIRRRLF